MSSRKSEAHQKAEPSPAMDSVLFVLERLMRFELTTATLARWRSTTELQPRNGAKGYDPRWMTSTFSYRRILKDQEYGFYISKAEELDGTSANLFTNLVDA